jgi:hypothetical protein
MTIHNRSALIIFALGTVWAVVFFFQIQDLFYIMSDWAVRQGQLDFRHALSVIGYIIWLSWGFLGFSNRGSKASILIWPITIFYSAFMFIFDLLLAAFVPLFLIYFVWHAITIVFAYRSFWKDWALYDSAQKGQASYDGQQIDH